MKNFLFACFLLLMGQSSAQSLDGRVQLDYYLPAESYLENIPTPSVVLGHEIGEWHISHDKLVEYMRRLSEASERVSLKVIGETYEGRPLIHLAITSPENQQKLEELQRRHKAWAMGKLPNGSKDIPLVVNLGYSVHGNEASGANAALLVAYYLAASTDPALLSFMEKNIILIDPSLNPDGMQRFSTWVNMHRSRHNLNAEAYSREHQEEWPGGRTNHYWFDLNRDWLPLQHPESRARIHEFHAWMPNFLTDHHEMGSNGTFFFQPGIPSSNNPLTPPEVFSLTEKVAQFHGQFLDSIGSLYYTRESFDDFYYGKGSTYPDLNGGVGILFEQASARGHLQESVYGPLSFPFAIRNQFVTSLSTLAAMRSLREELLQHQRKFYQTAIEEANRDTRAGFIMGNDMDPIRAWSLAQIIQQHNIEVYQVNGPLNIEGKSYDNGYLIPLKQPQYRLIKTMFETVTTFTDSLFYDVSTWTMPLAFNLPYRSVSQKELNSFSLLPVSEVQPSGKDLRGYTAHLVAAGFSWSHYFAPMLVHDLVKAGAMPRAITERMLLSTGDILEPGSIVVSFPVNQEEKIRIRELLDEGAARYGIDILPISKGLNQGIDLGSPAIRPVVLPKILLLVGDGVSSYDAGEIWHLLDERFEYPVTLVDIDDFRRADLSKFTHLVMANGNYSNLPAEQIADWMREGGTLVAMKGAVRWLSTQSWADIQLQNAPPNRHSTPLPYGEKDDRDGAQVVGGLICNTIIDTTHPLGFGFSRNTLPVFKNASYFLAGDHYPYGHPVRYTASPIASGYLSSENMERLAESPAVTVVKVGRGNLIAMADDPAFRAYWYGSQKLLINALFHSYLLD
ncbi:MAG: M14 family zinc carboxypeptidase [Bacteroidia bacterium]|nr:M14 family zinc carboxypeptidase [Bacteroidia bacterium]